IIGGGDGPLTFNVAHSIDTQLQADGGVKLIKALEWTDNGNNSPIVTPVLSQMQIGGNFGAPLSVTGTGSSLGTVIIKGEITGGAWSAAGNANKIQAGKVD